MKEHPLILSAPMVRAVLNTAPGVWPAKALDPSRPFKWQTRRLAKKLRVKLRGAVRSDTAAFGPSHPELVAKRGTYAAKMGRAGAVSIDVGGVQLGVKPGEFDFVCPYSVGQTSLTTWGDFRKYGEHGARWEVQAGDDVWFRETWAIATGNGHRVVYRADVDTERWPRTVAVDSSSRWKTPIYMPRDRCRLTARIRRLRLEFLQDFTEADARAEGADPETHSCFSGDQRIIGTDKTKRDFPHMLAFAMLWDEINAERAPWNDNPLVWVIEFERVT